MQQKTNGKKQGKQAGFSDEERAAMRERYAELQITDKKEGEKIVLEKIAQLPEPDRTLAQRLHRLITTNAPSLTPKTWYGMPAYAKNDKVVCFFQSASKFKARYATIGFSDNANLDDGNMWPTNFALKKLSSAEEEQIAALVKKAIS